MFFHVLLTTECDLQCKYCYGKSCDDIDSDFQFDIDYSLPQTLNYDIAELAAFCEKDPDCVLSFYGGEPTLCLGKMKQILDNVEAKHFLLQTNGLHLDKLEPEYVDRLHTILVSIDGNQKLTDYYRGAGVYQRIIHNLKIVRRNGFVGEIVARMTVMERTDIVKAVMWLLRNQDFSFSSIHWQLDAGFWETDYVDRNFGEWATKSYDPGIRRLVKFWVNEMEKGNLVRLYPFLGLMRSMLHNEESLLRCGSGWINYSILTNGTIVPCPIMSGMKDFSLGHVSTSNPLKLHKFVVSEPCSRCEILGLCGGRCLYANITKRWSDEAYSRVCATVKNLVSTLSKAKPTVDQLITSKKIQLAKFDYMKYSGCEIIP
ncbi:MAG: TIGR04084 family radical SAM/SPASM domain-containing protein [Candidatus Bathyarchaeota archaeon]|nr:MAG: TIGR04084 family radical SAM/SPASM domain-containing protein [Candidatus Bathyarchaeota archaeon]